MFWNKKNQQSDNTELPNETKTTIEELDALKIEEKRLHNLQMKVAIATSIGVPIVCVVVKELLGSLLGAKQTTNHYIFLKEGEETNNEDIQ